MTKNQSSAVLYLAGTAAQIATICIVVFLLRLGNVDYPKFCDPLFIALGGSSSAIWGIIVSRKAKRIDSVKRVFLDFFSLRTPASHYAIVAIFLTVIFGFQVLFGHNPQGIAWTPFALFFIQAILFGGIEEIGWRYTFQPLLEETLDFEASTLLTFLSWGLWHYAYFYIADSAMNIEHVPFLLGLLGSSFVLGAIFKLTGSLWLCVLYHSLFNAFSQMLPPSGLSIVAMGNLVCIALSIVLVRAKAARPEA